MNYIKVKNKRELLQLLAKPSYKKVNSFILAGGTDLIVSMEHFGLDPDLLVDAKGIKSLSGIGKSGNRVRIGSFTTVTELLHSDLIAEAAPLLREAAAAFAADQIRNRSTIGGNICNASPAGDLIPPLYALEAKLKLESSKGSRTLSIENFFKGPGKTVLKPNEILSEISFSAVPSDRYALFYKLGQRESMAIAVVSIATVFDLEKEKYENVRIGLGAVAPTVIRAYRTEKFLEGKVASEEIAEEAGKIASEESSPISDVRGSAEYRRLMIERLTKELLLNRK